MSNFGYDDLEEKADSLTDLISHKAVYRTAPATPGLLNILTFMIELLVCRNGAYLEFTVTRR